MFLFADIWFPGLEALAYIRDGMGLKFKITGCIFAGSYDPHDFLAQKGMGYWAKNIEEGWFRFVDKLFVATEFHKRLIYTTRDIDPNKMAVTWHPLYYEQVKKFNKENILVFPHRLDPEKHPEMFDEMRKIYWGNWKLIRRKRYARRNRNIMTFLKEQR